jgi:hypothetical protein
MRKTKLVVNYELGAKIIGLVTTLKDYKLAWSLNQVFNISLIMQPLLVIKFVKGVDLSIVNYAYLTDLQQFRLIKNKGNEINSGYLIPELSNFDFFIMISGDEDQSLTEIESKKLHSITGVNYFQIIDVAKLKSKDNFIF